MLKIRVKRWNIKVFGLALLCFISSPKAVAMNSCSSSDVDTYISKLDQLEQEEIEFLSQCETAIQPLISALESENSEIASNAALVLQWMGSSAKEAAQPLTDILLDSNKSISLRTSAAYALQTIRSDDRRTTKALLTVIRQEKNSDLRSTAALALATNSNGEKEVIESLLSIVKSLDDNSVRYAAAYTIGEIARSHQESVRSLVGTSLLTILQDPKENGRVIRAYPKT